MNVDFKNLTGVCMCLCVLKVEKLVHNWVRTALMWPIKSRTGGTEAHKRILSCSGSLKPKIGVAGG